MALLRVVVGAQYQLTPGIALCVTLRVTLHASLYVTAFPFYLPGSVFLLGSCFAVPTVATMLMKPKLAKIWTGRARVSASRSRYHEATINHTHVPRAYVPMRRRWLGT